MSVTTPTNVDTSINEVWAKSVLRRHKAAGFWGRFVGGEGSGSPIIQKSELLNSPGDLIHIQVTDPLSGVGVSGDTATLVGNEENLATSEIKASPTLYRHAVRINRRANKKSILDLREEMAMRLSEWGMNKMDTLRFSAFTGTTAPVAGETYTPNVYAVATADSANDGGTTIGDTAEDVALADTLSVKAIQVVKLKLTTALAKPLGSDGFPYYVLVASPYATFQLKQESRYESWVRDAEVRGKDNPFFRGALAVIDGVILYEHPNVTRTANVAGVQVANNIAFGAEAFVEALDENPHSNEDTFDYALEFGKSYEFAVQSRRALELSSLQVKCSAPTV